MGRDAVFAPGDGAGGAGTRGCGLASVAASQPGAEDLFNRVRSTRRAKRRPDRVAAYVKQCRVLVERAEETLKVLQEMAGTAAQCVVIQGFIAHARRQMDQVERRLLQDETIPHEEKVFSIFEEHTRWISKGKAGRPVELGVPVCVIEDQYQFILHHQVLWQGGDVDVAVPMIQETQALHPDFRVCSFDRGFHSPENRLQLDDLLDLNALPRKGRHSRADGSARQKKRLPPPGGNIRQWSRRSIILSIAALTASAPMVLKVLRRRSRCRCWPPTCTALDCCCGDGLNDDAPPDRLAGFRPSPPARGRERFPVPDR